VAIEIEDTPGRSLLIEKRQLVSVADDGSRETQVGNPVYEGKLRQHGSPTRDLENPKKFIEEWFPGKLENFILFDAEQLANFFSPQTRAVIEEAVLKIAGVETLDRAINGLSDQLVKFDRDFARLGGKKTEGLQERKEALQIEFDGCRKEIDEQEIIFQDAGDSLRGLAASLAKFEVARERLETLQELRDRRGSLSTQFDNEELSQRDELIRNGYLFYLGHTLDAVDAHYEEGVKEGFPLPFQTESLRLILQTGTCVCGCNLAQAGHEAHLKDLIQKQSVAEGVDKALPQTKALAMTLRTTIDAKKSASQNKNMFINSLHQSIREIDEEIASIDSGAAKAEEWQGLFDDERRLEARKTNAQNSVTRGKIALNKLRDDLTRVQSDIDKSAIASAQNSKLRKITAFLNKCIDGAKEARAQGIEKVRKSLEDSMNEQYSNIKNGSYTVGISNKFEVHLKNTDAQQVSEGEKMSLAYSFAVAIRQSLGMQFPLVVDSAFGRLDSMNRDWLTRALVNLVVEDDKRQAIFLMHDLEYTPSTRKSFQAAMPNELYLNHDDDLKTTDILPGIDPGWLSGTTGPWSEKGGN
tara:strand:+ start:3274 stop:5019 length:1746 start_codon:yes stop_codon:yes gene_type:complete